MAFRQTFEPASDLVDFSFTFPKHMPASSSKLDEVFSGTGFEFANPALLQVERATPKVSRSDMRVSEKPAPNDSVFAERISLDSKQQHEKQNRGAKIAESLNANRTRQDEKNAESNGSCAKKCKGWREFFRFKKPHFLRRSNSASKAEKPVCPAWDPWLGRSGSDPKTVVDPKSISGQSEKDSQKPRKYSKLSDSSPIQGFREDRTGGKSPAKMGSPARMGSPKYSAPRCGDTIAMGRGGVFGADLGPSKLQKSMQQARRRDDLQRYLKKPNLVF